MLGVCRDGGCGLSLRSVPVANDDREREVEKSEGAGSEGGHCLVRLLKAVIVRFVATLLASGCAQ